MHTFVLIFAWSAVACGGLGFLCDRPSVSVAGLVYGVVAVLLRLVELGS